MKNKSVAASWLGLVAVILALIPISACISASPAESAPQAPTGAGTPQDPCLGTIHECGDRGQWYVTTIKVGERQVPCISQRGLNYGALTMSCDWTAR